MDTVDAIVNGIPDASEDDLWAAAISLRETLLEMDVPMGAHAEYLEARRVLVATALELVRRAILDRGIAARTKREM